MDVFLSLSIFLFLSFALFINKLHVSKGIYSEPINFEQNVPASRRMPDNCEASIVRFHCDFLIWFALFCDVKFLFLYIIYFYWKFQIFLNVRA